MLTTESEIPAQAGHVRRRRRSHDRAPRSRTSTSTDTRSVAVRGAAAHGCGPRCGPAPTDAAGRAASPRRSSRRRCSGSRRPRRAWRGLAERGQTRPIAGHERGVDGDRRSRQEHQGRARGAGDHAGEARRSSTRFGLEISRVEVDFSEIRNPRVHDNAALRGHGAPQGPLREGARRLDGPGRGARPRHRQGRAPGHPAEGAARSTGSTGRRRKRLAPPPPLEDWDEGTLAPTRSGAETGHGDGTDTPRSSGPSSSPRSR